MPAQIARLGRAPPFQHRRQPPDDRRRAPQEGQRQHRHGERCRRGGVGADHAQGDTDRPAAEQQDGQRAEQPRRQRQIDQAFGPKRLAGGSRGEHDRFLHLAVFAVLAVGPAHQPRLVGPCIVFQVAQPVETGHERTRGHALGRSGAQVCQPDDRHRTGQTVGDRRQQAAQHDGEQARHPGHGGRFGNPAARSQPGVVQPHGTGGQTDGERRQMLRQHDRYDERCEQPQSPDHWSGLLFFATRSPRRAEISGPIPSASLCSRASGYHRVWPARHRSRRRRNRSNVSGGR